MAHDNDTDELEKARYLVKRGIYDMKNEKFVDAGELLEDLTEDSEGGYEETVEEVIDDFRTIRGVMRNKNLLAADEHAENLKEKWEKRLDED